MSIAPILGTELKQGIEFSSASEKLTQIAEWIYHYATTFIAVIVSTISNSPFKYMMTLQGPKKAISATLSLSLKRLAKMLPFQMWAPKLSINITCKFKKI